MADMRYDDTLGFLQTSSSNESSFWLTKRGKGTFLTLITGHIERMLDVKNISIEFDEEICNSLTHAACGRSGRDLKDEVERAAYKCAEKITNAVKMKKRLEECKTLPVPQVRWRDYDREKGELTRDVGCSPHYQKFLQAQSAYR